MLVEKNKHRIDVMKGNRKEIVWHMYFSDQKIMSNVLFYSKMTSLSDVNGKFAGVATGAVFTLIFYFSVLPLPLLTKRLNEYREK